jgi:hypothetical protein
MDKVFTNHLWLRCAARFTVSLAVTVLSTLLIGTVEPIQAQETAPKAAPEARQAPTTPTTTRIPTEVQPKPSAEELQNWHKAIMKIPTPKKGCFTAEYPNTAWRETPCKTPPHKLYLPRRTGATRTQQVGGASDADFVAVVSGNMTEAEGSFDKANVTSECDVQCPNQICPSNPSCIGGEANSFSLQLNTNPFSGTTTCESSPTPKQCKGWEQFVYAQDQNCSECIGDVFIQYWLLNFGPAGTACPSPVAPANECDTFGVVSNQWCSFQFTPTGPVFCVMNGPGSASPLTVPISLLYELALIGDTASGGKSTDSTEMVEGGTAFLATGGNIFPDLGTLWKDTEFNVFGNGGGSEAVFNNGAAIQVRTSVSSGITNGPACKDVSFTGESNNLTLVNSAPTAMMFSMPALVFSESNPAPSGATCADATSVGVPPPPPPPPPSVIKAKITVSTGNDNARSDTELWATINGEPAFCLKPSNNANPDKVCNNGGGAKDLNGNQSWNNWTSSAQTFSLVTPKPLSAITSLTIQLLEHNNGTEGDDNWDIQGITVVLTDTTGATHTVLNLSNPHDPNNSNNCLARLKGSPNSTTVAFSLNGTSPPFYVGGNAAGQTTTCSNNGDQ